MEQIIAKAQEALSLMDLEVWPESHWPGFCATRGRRIQDLYGMVVHVIRCNTHYAIDNRR